MPAPTKPPLPLTYSVRPLARLFDALERAAEAAERLQQEIPAAVSPPRPPAPEPGQDTPPAEAQP